MKHFLALSFAALLLSLAHAEAKAPAFLQHAQYDPARILPPPPAPGSPDAVAESTELERIQAARTPASFAAATSDAHNETVKMFAVVLGPAFDIKKLPATEKLFADIAATEEIVSKRAKDYFKRSRPYIVDPKLTTCETPKPAPAENSYPSGHATVAFMMGEVLAALIPDKAQAILARSEEFAENRLVCGVHFRSDIAAGQAFGTLMAADLMQSTAFKLEYETAAAELRAAHMTR